MFYDLSHFKELPNTMAILQRITFRIQYGTDRDFFGSFIRIMIVLDMRVKPIECIVISSSIAEKGTKNIIMSKQDNKGQLFQNNEVYSQMYGVCSEDSGNSDPTRMRKIVNATKTDIPKLIFSPLCGGMKNTSIDSVLIMMEGNKMFKQ